MPTNNNTPLQDKLRACKNWDDLKGAATFQEAQQSLIARELNRVYHKRRSQKQSAILRAAKAAVEAGTLQIPDLEGETV